MGCDGDDNAHQHHGLPHQHLLLFRRPLRCQVLRRRRERVRSAHPDQPPRTPVIYACCRFCGGKVRTEGIFFLIFHRDKSWAPTFPAFLLY